MSTAAKKKFSGWSVVFGCFLLMFFITAIVASTTSLFMPVVCKYFNFDVAAYSVINLIGSLCSAIGAMVIAPKMQKGNLKVIMIVCLIITGLGFAALGMCREMWQFYAVFAICNLGFGGLNTLPIAMMVTAWFKDKRSLAMGIAFTGTGFGTTLWATVFSKIMASSPEGWITCYFLGGGIVLVMGILVTVIFAKKAPQLYGQEEYTEEAKPGKDGAKAEAPKETWNGVSKGIAFKSMGFIMLVCVMLLLGCLAAGVATHAINFLVSVGWNIQQASTVLTVFSLTGIVGTFVGGLLFEKLGAKNGILAACVLAIIGLLGLVFAGTIPAFAYLYGICFALGMMMPKMVPALLTSTVFGVKDYASIYATLNLFFLVGCSAGAVVTGLIAKVASYNAAWFAYMVFSVLIFICSAAALADGRKLRAKYPNEVAPKEANAEVTAK